MKALTFKTPIDEILFRSSKVGLLASGYISNKPTALQYEEMKRLQAKADSFVGLSDKQQEKLDKYDKAIADGLTITPKQMEERDDFKKRLVTKKELTPNEAKKLSEIIEKDKADPELSKGAKTYIKSVWLENEKGFREDITSKHCKKGLQAEEDSITLISMIDDVMYSKNTKRVTKANLTGECDVIHHNKELDVVIIDDVKTSWNPRTFMSSVLTTEYEWQGRAYMYLYDAEVFRLRYCLVDCPPEVYFTEKESALYRFKKENGIIDDALEENALAISDFEKQFDKNFLYADSGRYNEVERVKTFMIDRDLEMEDTLIKAVQLGVKYYKTITLNMKN